MALAHISVPETVGEGEGTGERGSGGVPAEGVEPSLAWT